jgi:hypothetical protein
MSPGVGVLIAVVALAALAVALARLLQSRALAKARSGLEARARRPAGASTDGPAITTLPPPVQRYLCHVLPEGTRPIRLARYTQSGQIRTATDSPAWMPFTATQLIAPAEIEFLWVARVALAPLLNLQVRDAFAQAAGSGRVLLWSAIPAGASSGSAEMNAGSLHRFLAEAAWYPTALLPSPALRWRAIDDSRALATLTQGETTVSLEFRFNEADEISAIYTPARWGRFGRVFRQVPWEGHFGGYRRVQGVLVPGEGEVGWYAGGQWQAVWRGRVDGAEFEFAPA